MFDSVPSYGGDPILSLQQDFQRDPRPDKANLSIGLYYDEAGKVPVLESVRAARAVLDGIAPPPGYLPMSGDPQYCAGVQALIFGAASDALHDGRIATVQTVGGSGALKVGADFLHGIHPGSGVWVSSPTWDNHRAIFEGAGFVVESYPYFDESDNSIAFDRMLSSLRNLPACSIVLLHPCCHNPTGMDLSHEQWDSLIDVMVARRLIAFLDMAYQGYGEDIDDDGYAVRALADAQVSFLIAHSFSKTFSMYSARCGSLSVVCDTAQIAVRVHGQLQSVIRRNYSSPPASGARVIAHVLHDPMLRQAWFGEVRAMKERIQAMRRALFDEVGRHPHGLDWEFLLKQRGLFSYAPRLGAMANELRVRHGIYILESGRICIAGLTLHNVERVGRAFADQSRAQGPLPFALPT